MKRFLVLVCVVVLANCSGHANAVLPTGGSQSNSLNDQPQGPPIITESFIRDAEHIDAPNIPLSLPARFFKKMSAARPTSSAGPGDQEEVGFKITPGGPYTGIYALETALPNFQIAYPKGSTGASTLFAPVVIPPNGSCLGAGEVYTNSGKGTSSSFTVINECSGTILYSTPIDVAFAQAYTSTQFFGEPELRTLVYTWDSTPTATSVWYAFLYNFATKRWDIVASAKGLRTSGIGYSSWKSEFVAGPCPSTPEMRADSMALFNGTNHAFENLKPVMKQTAVITYKSKATCFSSDNVDYNFVFDASIPIARWDVISVGPWHFRAPMPTHRWGLATAVNNGILYAIGGNRGGTNGTAAVDGYDVGKNTWQSLAPLPSPREALAAVAINGMIYAVGGGPKPNCISFCESGALEAYNPTTNTWSEKAPMPTPRAELGVGVVNGILYAVGGHSEAAGILRTLEAYDPARDAWVTLAPMPTESGDLAVAVSKNILYVIQGTGLVEGYDPRTNTWTAKASMPAPRDWLAAVPVNGLIYAMGGIVNGNVTLNTMEAYDPSTNTWSNQPPMTTPRYGLSANTVNGALYAVGGVNYATYLNSIETFTP